MARTRVHRSEPSRDIPSLGSLAFVAAAGLAFGLALAYATLEEDLSERRLEPEAGEAQAGTPSAPPEEPANEAAEPMTEAETGREAEPVAAIEREAGEAASAGAPDEPEPPSPAIDGGLEPLEGAPGGSAAPPHDASLAEERTAPASTPRTMRRGRIAYIRCASGARPCPRDRALEAEIWALLEGLASCPGAPPGSGRADIRFHFSGAGAELRFRDFEGEGPLLDYGRIQACLAESAAALRSDLDEESFLLSVRFELRSR
ncbi:MAG: hypothetical protein OEY14_10720 [Myxococcales bacterium]|nr:hypothetical protein [Myxococcales bacterium]